MIGEEAPEGITAFEMAVFTGQLKLAEMFLSNGSNPLGPPRKEAYLLRLLLVSPFWYIP
jgi:ankyrin repeat protein